MIKRLQALRVKKGFTLSELMVVIAIIGILAVILVPNMMSAVVDTQIKTSNIAAQDVRDMTTAFFLKMNAAKTPLQLGGVSLNEQTNHATISIIVEDFEWKYDDSATSIDLTGVKGASTKNRDWLDGVNHWQIPAATGENAVSNTDNKSAEGIKGTDTALLSYLADTLSEIKNAYITIYVSAAGKVTGVAFVDGATEVPSVPIPGVDSFLKGSDKFLDAATNGTASAKAGVAGNVVIGTDPELSLDTGTAADE